MLRSIVNSVKGWFNNAWSIFLARLEIFTGFVLGVVAAIDWSNLASIDFDAGFSNNQITWIAIGLVIKGIVSEIGRRSGTVTAANGQLIPTNIAKKADIKVQK